MDMKNRSRTEFKPWLHTFNKHKSVVLLKHARKKEICIVLHHQSIFYTKPSTPSSRSHSLIPHLNCPGRCYHGVICWRNPWCRCQIKLPPYWIVMSASNVSKVYWCARCGLVWVGGWGGDKTGTCGDWLREWLLYIYVAVLKDYVFSFVIFGSLSKNTKTAGLKKTLTVTWWCRKPSKKEINPQFRLFESEFNGFYSWQLGASKLFLLDRMKLPESVQKSCAINCHIGWGYYMAACRTRCWAGETAWDIENSHPENTGIKLLLLNASVVCDIIWHFFSKIGNSKTGDWDVWSFFIFSDSSTNSWVSHGHPTNLKSSFPLFFPSESVRGKLLGGEKIFYRGFPIYTHLSLDLRITWRYFWSKSHWSLTGRAGRSPCSNNLQRRWRRISFGGDALLFCPLTRLVVVTWRGMFCWCNKKQNPQ